MQNVWPEFVGTFGKMRKGGLIQKGGLNMLNYRGLVKGRQDFFGGCKGVARIFMNAKEGGPEKNDNQMSQTA